MKYFAVVDTNVLVSAFLKPGSIPWQVIELIRNNVITPIYNDDIINEYYDVCLRNEFNFDNDIVEANITYIKEVGIKLTPLEIDEFFADKKDIVFYQIVMSARLYVDSETRLVTGNLKHFPNKEFIVTPRQIIEIINKKESINSLLTSN